MKKSIFFATLLLGSACSFKKSELKNQSQNGHEELYSEPSEKKLETLAPHIKRIVIASTSDIQGHYAPEVVTFKDDISQKEGSIRIGGEAALNAYIKILREQFGEIILVDSGDFFPDDTTRLNETKKFYDNLRYDALTVGLTDFSLKLPKGTSSTTQLFKEYAKDSTPPLVLSNLLDLKTGRNVDWPGSRPYLLKEINGTKVGIIGLVADDIASQTPVNNRVGFFVESKLETTLRYARLLRSLGADVIVVTTHEGIKCGEVIAQDAKLPMGKVNFEPTKANICDTSSVLGQYLNRLPPLLVDVVIGGRTHEKVANYINETLVISGYEFGKSFNYVEFLVDTQARKVLREKTVVHQPVMTCHEFFKETKDCFTEDSSVDHKERIPATFLGKPIIFEVSPKSTTTTSMSIPQKSEVAKALVAFEADISYLTVTSGKTQLLVLDVTGTELSNLLEEEFNQNNQELWYPSPFLQKTDGLHLTLSGLEIEAQKHYKILSDVESLQSSSLLRKLITKHENRSLAESSWNSLDLNIDVVQTALAAPEK